MNCCEALFAILCPPIVVAMRKGCGCDLCINLLLCLLFWIPGCIHACVIASEPRRVIVQQPALVHVVTTTPGQPLPQQQRPYQQPYQPPRPQQLEPTVVPIQVPTQQPAPLPIAAAPAAVVVPVAQPAQIVAVPSAPILEPSSSSGALYPSVEEDHVPDAPPPAYSAEAAGHDHLQEKH